MPSATAIRAISNETAKSAAPSSIPGSIWQCRSIMGTPQVRRAGSFGREKRLGSYQAGRQPFRHKRIISNVRPRHDGITIERHRRQRAHKLKQNPHARPSIEALELSHEIGKGTDHHLDALADPKTVIAGGR